MAYQPYLVADKADTQREASVADILLTNMADSSPLAEQAEAEVVPH